MSHVFERLGRKVQPVMTAAQLAEFVQTNGSDHLLWAGHMKAHKGGKSQRLRPYLYNIQGQHPARPLYQFICDGTTDLDPLVHLSNACEARCINPWHFTAKAVTSTFHERRGILPNRPAKPGPVPSLDENLIRDFLQVLGLQAAEDPEHRKEFLEACRRFSSQT